MSMFGSTSFFSVEELLVLVSLRGSSSVSSTGSCVGTSTIVLELTIFSSLRVTSAALASLTSSQFMSASGFGSVSSLHSKNLPPIALIVVTIDWATRIFSLPSSLDGATKSLFKSTNFLYAILPECFSTDAS